MRQRLLPLFALALAGLLTGAGLAAPAASQPHDQVLLIYADGLQPEWEDWSWGGVAADLTNPDPVFSGTASIAVTFTGGWSGLQFGRGTPLSVGDYDSLRFYVHGGGSGGQHIVVYIGNDCSAVQQAVTPTAGLWTAVEVPLRRLGWPRQVQYVYWFNATSSAQPTFYLDEVAFVAHSAPPPPPTPEAGPALAVDAAADHHPISPYIYGMSFADEELANAVRLPLRRWGGNSTTRYSWQNDTSNRGSDWYFENVPEPGPGLPDGSASDQFVEQNLRTGTATLLTIPLIGWTPKAHDYACGFSVSKYGPQQSTDPWRPDCGNGEHVDGTYVTGNDPLDTSLAITPTFVQAWVEHLVGKYGSAAQGGVGVYDLDNEPMLWYSTHRDVHPYPTTYDEVRDRTLAYAAAIRAADPTAQTAGPAVWGWTAYFWSALDWETPGFPANAQDREAHGGVPFLEWYLQQMQAYDQEHGARLLDYLDVHYYPQGQGIFSAQAGDEAVQALRLRSTRSLWDPDYSDESWIAEPVYLIPRLRAWVEANYPGTGTAIGEYSWGAMCHISGALAQADVLGIFGREGLDVAALWGPPTANEPGAFAFRLYRDCDGTGLGFGTTSVRASSADPDRLALYAALRSEDGALTLMVVNKSALDLTSTVALSGFAGAGFALVYRYSDQHLDAIVHEPNLAVGPGGFTALFPGNSITLLAIPPAGWPTWQAYLPAVAKDAASRGAGP